MLLALTLAVALVAPPPPSELAQAGAPAVREPRRSEGIGLITVGALAGAVGLGLGLASAQAMAELESCVDCPRRLPPTMFAAVALNTASVGLLAGGASLRGRARGSHDAVHGASRAARVPWISLGALVTAGGVLFVGAGLAWRFAEPSRASATPWALLQVGMSSVVAGSGLLVYGLTYRKYASTPREVRLRVAPQLGGRHLGLALVGEF